MTQPLPPVEPEPSNRWPWVALAAGVLVIVLGVAIFLFNQNQRTVVTIAGTPTANPVARTASPPPTLVAPTLPPSQPTTTPQPSPTPEPPTPTVPPKPTTPPPPTQPPVAVPATPPADQGTPASQGAPPTAVAATPPTTAPQAATAVPPTQPPAAPSPTPFSGQVSNAGGVGNARQDMDAAYGAPAGETPEHLVVYKKNNLQYHVGLVPDINGRAALLVEIPPQTPPMMIDAAVAEARKLLPKDAQPPNAPQEGNDQFVLQRFTSATLAQALGPDIFQNYGVPPGQFMAAYARDASQGGRITRIIVGVGKDANDLLNRGK